MSPFARPADINLGRWVASLIELIYDDDIIYHLDEDDANTG
jgi:hypothetical protein